MTVHNATNSTSPMAQNGDQLTLVYEARRQRDHAIHHVETGSDDWARTVIDQAIREVAARGVPFSANDVRPLLPPVRPALIGARFLAASRSGLIRRVGYVQSTDPATHAHPVAEWVKA